MTQISTINPATDAKIADYDVMTRDAAFAKVQSCHDAFTEWRQKNHAERAPYLTAIAEKLRENSDALAEMMTKEMGKLLRDGKTEVELCARIFEYTAENG
ncbi:MAG: aldehyde dehydrogenase family protein, partial [Sulfitobacter sp.]